MFGLVTPRTRIRCTPSRWPPAKMVGPAVLILPTLLLALDMTVLHHAAPQPEAPPAAAPARSCCGSWISRLS